MAHNSAHEDECNEREYQEKLKADEARVKLSEAKELLKNEKPHVAKQEAMRFDDDKLRLDLIPVEALIELARVYSMGAIKYDDDNWRKGMPWSKCIRATLSHFFKWRSGQVIDPETGCHHLAQVAWNALTLLVYELNKSGKDDRQKFAIDEDFNWVDNHLGIGLSKEEIKALKLKYKDRK